MPSIGCPSALTTRPIKLFAHRHRDDPAGALDRVPFADLLVFAEQHGADAVLLEVQRDPEDAVRELEHLAGHRVLDPVHPCDAVADRHDRADFRDVDVDRVAADLVADDFRNFFCFDVHGFVWSGCVPRTSGAVVLSETRLAAGLEPAERPST